MKMASRFTSVALVSCTMLLTLSTGQVVLGQLTTTTTTTTQQIAGVEIDADGVLRMHKFADPGGRLSRRRIEESLATMTREVARPSKLRKISLNRLEATVREALEGGRDVSEEMAYLAGLVRVQYVFYYPETKDIVIAGPAEPWATDLSGRVRGIDSGSPVVELRDLVVALRSYPPTGKATPVISVSIDPTKEGLANMQQFLARLGGRAVPSQTNFIANGLRRSLGMQVITVKGVPANTHFAEVLVEADYRMKLIGIGLERTRVRDLKAYVDLANPVEVSRNAMQRWYFVPNYECVRASEDGLAMEMVGEGVKLIGADELVTSDGRRVGAGRSDGAGKRFVTGFTAKYPELARAVPVYAQLRNCIDMAVAAAFIQREGYYAEADWSMDLFGDEASFPVETGAAPSKVESAVASIWKRNRLMTPIGGGVNIQARQALNADNILSDDQGEVAEQRERISLDSLKDGQWWWD